MMGEAGREAGRDAGREGVAVDPLGAIRGSGATIKHIQSIPIKGNVVAQ